MSEPVLVDIINHIDISTLRQSTTLVSAIPRLVDIDTMEHLMALAVEDGDAVVAHAGIGLVETGTESSDVGIV